MTLFVWVTAASMLLAGTPRVECACTGPHAKTLGFTTADQGNTCCCQCCCPAQGTGVASSSSEGKPAKKSSCCGGASESLKNGQPERQPAPAKDRGKDHKQTPGNSGQELQAPIGGCQKTLVSPQQESLSSAEANDHQILSAHLLLFAVASPAFAMPGAIPSPTVWEVFRLPPPTDLVTLLQRLTI